ncbi:MAG: hypothetical protein R2746_10335 [Acidimicrobiales bacterium]
MSVEFEPAPGPIQVPATAAPAPNLPITRATASPIAWACTSHTSRSRQTLASHYT